MAALSMCVTLVRSKITRVSLSWISASTSLSRRSHSGPQWTLGPAANVLRTSPPDLTTLAKRHGGKFPYDYVFDVLRFGTRFASHGSSDMPIWGPIFGSMENYDEAAVRKRIKGFSDYLASRQQKES